MPYHQTCEEDKAWVGKKQYMAENIPESIFVVQLPIAHYSVYSSNNTWPIMTGCYTGGLGFYMLINESTLFKPSDRKEFSRITFIWPMDAGHYYQCWLNMRLSMCRDNKSHGFRFYSFLQLYYISERKFLLFLFKLFLNFNLTKS